MSSNFSGVFSNRGSSGGRASRRPSRSPQHISRGGPEPDDFPRLGRAQLTHGGRAADDYPRPRRQAVDDYFARRRRRSARSGRTGSVEQPRRASAEGSRPLLWEPPRRPQAPRRISPQGLTHGPQLTHGPAQADDEAPRIHRPIPRRGPPPLAGYGIAGLIRPEPRRYAIDLDAPNNPPGTREMVAEVERRRSREQDRRFSIRDGAQAFLRRVQTFGREQGLPRRRSAEPRRQSHDVRSRYNVVEAASPGMGRPENFEAGPSQRPSEQGEGYEVVRLLNAGGMSDSVNVVRSRRDGKLYIQKRISVPDQGMRYRVSNEIKALKSGTVGAWSHPNLNKMFSSTWSPNKSSVSLTLDHCDRGSLDERLLRHQMLNEPMPERFLWHAMLEMANGLAYLHHGVTDAINGSRQHIQGWDTISHLDLKPQNIFLTSEGVPNGGFPRVVIGDLGCSVFDSDFRTGKARRDHKVAGTANWDAPEANAWYSYKCDLWQVGAIIHCCAQLCLVPDRTVAATRKPCGNRYSSRLNYVCMMQLSAEAADRMDATRLVEECLIGLEKAVIRT